MYIRFQLYIISNIMYEYIPTHLNDFIIHKSIASKLSNLDKTSILNTIIYGPNNSGKKTLCYGILNNIMNIDNIQKQTTINTINAKINNNKISINYLSSPYHLEFNLYEYGLYDRYIISNYIRDNLKYKNINGGVLKFIILNHSDNISKDAQIALRKILDDSYSTTRFILLVSNLNKLNTNILSRCSTIRIPKPSTVELSEYISYFSDNFIKLNKPKQRKLLKSCNHNLFILHNMLKLLNNVETNKIVEVPDIQKDLSLIIKYININSIESIVSIRNIFYKLLLLNYNNVYIMKYVLNYYLDSDLPESNKYQLCYLVSSLEHKLTQVEHDLIGFEFFILKVKKILL